MSLVSLVIFLLLIIAALAIYYFGAAWIWTVVALVGSLITALITHLIWPLIIEVLGGKAEKNTPDTVSGLHASLVMRLNFLSSWRVWQHLSEQTKIIRKMPIVFKDVLGIEDLLVNFVDISATSIDIKTFKPKPTPPTSIKHFSDTLRENKKAILLGDAGTGKTTFQRHTALTIIQNRSDVRYLESQERIVPFYIQLRLIDNSEPFPIRRHLLNRTTYGAGARGRKRLLKLAREGRIFLFLDGYDETPFSLTLQSAGIEVDARREERLRPRPAKPQPTEAHGEDTEQEINYLRDELKLIMSPNMARIQSQKDRPIADLEFYRHLQGCRVWLTSRKSYFRNQRPFEQHEVPSTGLAALEIYGVDNRKNLIQKVFNKYKLIQDNKHLFKPELFFNMINRDAGELKSLSDNPLLLIIICRLYADAVVKTKNPRVKIANTLDAIIERYFELLIEELDKVRNEELNLSPAEEEWQREARGLYTIDKREFLKYFAARLYIENTGGFTREFIYDKATKFFNEVSSSEDKQEIIQGLKHRPALTDFVGQIVNSSIVVETAEEAPQKKPLYDFPHQRFRELLAAQYFDNKDRAYILQNLQRTALNELLYVFFRITSHKDPVIEGLLEHIAAEPKQAESYLVIFSRCLQEAPEYTPNAAFRNFLTRRLNLNLPFDIPKEVRQGFQDRRYFSPDEEFKQRLAEYLSDNEETVTNSARLGGELLLIYNEGLLRFVLISYFNRTDRRHNEESFSFRSELLHRFDHRVLKDFFPNLFWHYLEAADVHNLALCSKFIGRHAPETLRELFTTTLQNAVQYVAAQKDFLHPPRTALLLQESNGELLNTVLGEYLLDRIDDNSFSPLQHWLVDLHKPTKDFTLAWADAMQQALDNGRLYSLWLSVELGMYYDHASFRTQAQRLLLPALTAGKATIVQLVTLSPRINKFLGQVAQEDSPAKEILSLANMHGSLMPIALGSLMASPPPRNCYVITYQTIRELQRFAQERGLLINKKDWVKIYKLTHRVLLENTLLDQLPKEVDEELVTKLAELSQFTYANYDLIAKCMSEIDGNLPRENTYLKQKSK